MNDPHLTDSIFDDGDPASASAGQGGDRASAPTEPGRSRRTPGRTRHEPITRRKAGCSCLAILVAFVLVLGAGGYALRDALPHFASSAPTDYVGNGTGSVDITVNRGDTGYVIGQTLQKAGVVMSATTFASTANSNTKFAQVQPGTYRLRKHMSASAAITLMLQPAALVSHGIVIREGLWDQEIFALLSKKTHVPLADYRKVDPRTLGLPAAARGKLEGFLFPSTYTFDKGATAQQQLKMMVALGNSNRASLGIPDGKLLHIMTVASLVQGESRLGSDGPKVARVVQNRLAIGMPLQMDSTVHFAERQRGTVTTTNGQRASNSPYNTYKVRGLPPGPINNPGLAAITAALHPASGSWLYFVTVNQATGKTLFATTYSQQQVNEGKFHAWCRAHPGKC
ncbi:endolytic transglycosylase MltG [Leekyejoonella antrihumi]|uniref:Endolytic murein transglycosylase n=1 Tax=Leekyejoonella antrihumi TaxID=1660198 RepID=A0A563DXB9_9MICO|nr:endolytic transglycosylase MltG [Leekyejoonella antrihumi]TWP34866.1 endolytic transglycosylase MltG [Leekyejoonella antrihumi]